jgi:carbonic anhydrase/acetyltransferase-like protein (isoleucine patch superfamily)
LKSPRLPTPNIHPTAVVAPGAHIYGDVTIGAHVFVLFGVAIRAELDRIVVGSETNLQDNSVLHCDDDVPCLVGARVTVGHSAVVHGAEVGDRALIGIGARALNRSVVGEGAWLAAGSVLAEGRAIPPWTLAMGIPAKPVRDLTDDEVGRANEGVDHYLELAAKYREIFASNTRP